MALVNFAELLGGPWHLPVFNILFMLIPKEAPWSLSNQHHSKLCLHCEICTMYKMYKIRKDAKHKIVKLKVHLGMIHLLIIFFPNFRPLQRLNLIIMGQVTYHYHLITFLASILKLLPIKFNASMNDVIGHWHIMAIYKPQMRSGFSSMKFLKFLLHVCRM